MSWHHLWNDGAVISAHALIAIFAMLVGAFQIAAPKGTRLHQGFGYIWVIAMAVVAGSSFWIHEFRWVGPFSVIHLLSILVLGTLGYAIHAIRRSNVVAHRNAMLQLYALALLLTGAFTLVPGRTMYAVLFGG